MSKGTHLELCVAASKLLRKNGFSVVCQEFVSYCNETPDVIGFNSNFSCLIEVKISRQDFLNDFKKPHRRNKGVGNIRFYMTPVGLVKPEELPVGWGLIEFDGAKAHFVVGENLDIYQTLKEESSIKMFEPDYKEQNRVLVSVIRRINKDTVSNKNYKVYLLSYIEDLRELK